MHGFKAQATDTVRAAATKGKVRATEAVGSISKLIRDSAGTIDDNVGKQYGDYARSAADMVEGFAGKMDAKDVDALAEDARQFVRKSPAVAIGAAAAIGFVLARLVRSGGKDV
jgi:Na+/H+-translocating membrane pyrophosphatase